MEDVAIVDGTLLHMEISSDPMPMSSRESGVNFKGFGFGESPAPFVVELPSLALPLIQQHFLFLMMLCQGMKGTKLKFYIYLIILNFHAGSGHQTVPDK